MPINQYSEDPEARTTIDLDEAAKNFRKREERTGIPAMSPEQIAAAIGIDISGTPPQEDTIAGPPEALGPATPVDIRKAASGAQTGPVNPSNITTQADSKTAEALQAPTQVGGKSYKDFIWDLHQRGLSPGEAVGWWKRLYESGDPAIKNQAGADEFYRRIPSVPERFAEQTALGFARPFAGAAEWAGGLIGKENLEKVGNVVPGGEALGVFGTDATTKGLDEAAKRQVPLVSGADSLKNMLINTAPAVIGSFPAWDLAAAAPTALITKGLLQLPRYAEVAAKIADVTSRSRLGMALIEPATAVTKRYAELSKIAELGGQTVAGGVVARAEGQDWKFAAGSTAALMLGFGALGYGIRKTGWYEPDNLAKIMHYISNKSGIPATTLSQDMNHFGQIYTTLQEMKAPDSVLKTFMDGVPGKEWNGAVGEQFGRYLAEVGTLRPEIQKVMNFLPKEAQDKVFSSWGEAVQEKFTKQEWNKDLAGPPKPLPINEVPVHPVAEDFNGAQIFRSPASRFAAGAVSPITRPFQNPLTVTYDPTKELWSEAVIRDQSRYSFLDGKEALSILNRYPLTSAEYKATSDELAMRIANKQGYRSILASGGGNPNDNYFIDLMGHKGGDTESVAGMIEANLNNKAEKFFKSYPMIVGPIAGAAIGAGLLSPPESKAWDVAPVAKAIAKFGVPIAIGYGLYPDKADAAMDPGPLKELITSILGKLELTAPKLGVGVEEDVTRAINRLDYVGTKTSDMPFSLQQTPVEQVMDRLHAESPATGALFESVLNRQTAITGKTSVDRAVENYGAVLESLQEPLEIRPSIGEDAIPLPSSFEDHFVYHGTKKAYGPYDPAQFNPTGKYGPGLYTTSNPEVAGGYARTTEGEFPNIRPMKIKPETEFLDMEATIPSELGAKWKGLLQKVESGQDKYGYGTIRPLSEVVDEMVAQKAPMSDLYDLMTMRGFSKAKLNKLAAEDGYDGITHIGGRGERVKHRVWIVFDPNNLTEPAHGLAVTPTPAWARIIHAPTLEQEYGYRYPAKDRIEGWEGPTKESVQYRREQGWGPTWGVSKTAGEYGAGWDQAPGRPGITYKNIQKRQDSGVLEFEIGHDLVDGKIGRIGGYIDPVDHHWYVNAKHAADWGLGKAAFDSLVAAGIAAGAIRGVKGPFLKLALVAAVTGGATLLGAGQADAMPPWGKLFGIGPKGMEEVDNYVREIGNASAGAGVNAAANDAMKVAIKGTPMSFNDAAEALFAAGDIAPERVFGPEFRDIFTLGYDPNEHLTTASDVFKLPAYAIDDPEQVWVRMHSNNIIRKEAELTGINSVANEAVRHLDTIFGDSKVDADELFAAADGLERDGATNLLRQTNPDVSQEATTIAQRLVKEIDDPIFETYHGINPQAQAIIKAAGLPEKEDTWNLLRFLQDTDMTQGVPLWNGRKITAAEIMASEQTRGMLHFEAWHDLDTASSKQGILSKFPLANEQAQLYKEVKRLSDEYPNGVPETEGKKVLAIKNRLLQLKSKQADLRLRKTVELNRLGKKHFWGPRAESAELGLRIGLENDPRKIMAHYIHGALGQNFFNHELYFFRAGATWFDAMGQKDAAAYMRRYINTQRGLKSLSEDTWWASRWNRANQAMSKILRYHPNVKTIQNVRNTAQNALYLMYLGKLGLNPAFFLQNLTQPLLTGVVLPTRFLIQAIPKAIKAVLTNDSLMQEVAASGVLRATSHYATETGGVSSKLGKAADFLPNQSETFNRVLMHQAGKTYALDRLAKNKLRIQKHIAPYFDHSVLDRKATAEEVAKAYGAAVTRSTQFLQGPEGRPLIFSGGGATQIWGQFRSFQAGYGNLLLTTLKDDKPAFFRLLGSLVALGGLSALPFGDNLKDGLRAGVASLGGDPSIIPEGSIFGKAYEVLMGNESPLQITGSVTPLNYQSMNPFGDKGRFMDWVGGPTIGTARQGVQSLVDYGMGKTDASGAFTGVVKPLFPGTIGIAGLEALQESGVLKDLFDSMNYRGGIYSPTGAPLVGKRDDTNIMLRALNWQPSVRSQRNDYKFHIIEALQAGDYDQVKNLMEKARAAKFIFDKRDIGNMKSILAKQQSMQRPNQEIPE